MLSSFDCWALITTEFCILMRLGVTLLHLGALYRKRRVWMSLLESPLSVKYSGISQLSVKVSARFSAIDKFL